MERAHLTYLVTCEHASCAVPAGIALGVEPAVVATHVGWDPGAEPVAGALAAGLGVCPILGEHTRLVADLNRPETSAAVIPAVAFGVAVPGNESADREQRLDRYHRPYWARVEASIEAALARGHCIHISVHSFDGAFGADPRDFDVGLLFDPAFPREVALVGRLERALGAAGLVVQRNRPYAGIDEGLVQTLRHRYAAHPYTGIELELNQATIADPERPDPSLIKGLLAGLGGEHTT